MSPGLPPGTIGPMLWSDWCEERDGRLNPGVGGGAAGTGPTASRTSGTGPTTSSATGDADVRAATAMLHRCWWITAATAVLALLLIR